MLFGIYKMNNIIKIGLLTSLVFTTVIAMGLFGLSTKSMIDNVLAEKPQEGKNSNNDGNTATGSSSDNNNNVKCNPFDTHDCWYINIL